MRFLWVIFLLCMAATADAREVFSGPLDVKVGEAVVGVPTSFDVYTPDRADDPMEITVTGVITPLLDPLANLVEAELPGIGNGCERRVSSPGMRADVSTDILTLSGQVQAEFWVCGLIKTRLGRETADVRIGVAFGVSEGRLAFRMAECRVGDLDALGQALNLGRKLCAGVQRGVDKANADFDRTAPPKNLGQIGFRYTTFRVFAVGNTALLLATLEGPNDLARLTTFLAQQR